MDAFESSTEATGPPVLDQAGRTFVVTGGDKGVGMAVSCALARRGGHVVIASPDPGELRTALARLRAELPTARVAGVAVNLASLASVHKCALELRARYEKIDVLINNAAVMDLPQTSTVDGFEAHFGANHLGHFALTGLLLPLIESRIVTVSSPWHTRAEIVFSDIPMPASYDPVRAFAMSKLANLLFSFELDRRLATRQQPLALAGHAGFAPGAVPQARSHRRGACLARLRDRVAMARYHLTAEEGARALVHAACAEDARGGEYYGPNRGWGPRDGAKLAAASAAARDPEMGKRLWTRSEELTRIVYDFEFLRA